MTTNRRREGAFALLATLLFLAVVCFQPFGTRTVLVTDVALGLVAAAVGWRWVRSSRFAAGRLRSGLRLLGIGCLFWSGGQLLWTSHLAFGGRLLSDASTAYFDSAAALMAIGVAWMAASRRMRSLRTGLDALIIATSLYFVGWATVLGPMFRTATGTHVGLTGLLFPATDVLVATMTILMLYEVRGPRRSPLEFSAVGLMSIMATDAWYACELLRGTYHEGHWLDTGWFAGFLILLVGTPRLDEIGGSVTMSAGDRSRTLLPYLPFGAALVTGVAHFVLHDGTVDPVLYVLTVVLTVLILLRQVFSLRDNRVLTRDLHRAVEDLHHRAYHDELTGLANRAQFVETAEQALGERAPGEGSPGDGAVALLYVDLDGFKPINDTFGHAAGDRVLVAVADRLRLCVRDTDLVARLGGDEFAILLRDPAVPDAAQVLNAASGSATERAEEVADRVRLALSAPMEPAGVSGSVGVAYGIPGQTDLDDLMSHADAAMYAAKDRARIPQRALS